MNALLQRAGFDQNISKNAMRVLDVLIQAKDEELQQPTITASEIARRLRLPESTVFRALAVLKERGYIMRESSRGATGIWQTVTHILAA